MPPPGGPGGPGVPAGPPGSWSPTDAVGFGWNALTKNIVGIGVGIGVATIVMVLPSSVINGLNNVLVVGLSDSLDSTVASLLSISLSLIGLVVSICMQAYIMGGIVEVSLRSARGETTTLGDVFGGGKYFGAFLVGSIINQVLVIIGSILCVVPGVIVALGLCLYGQFIVDRKLSGVDAIKASWELTKGHKVNLFVFFIIGFFVSLAGLLACGVGVIFGSGPLLAVAVSYIYLRLQGENPRLPAGT